MTDGSISRPAARRTAVLLSGNGTTLQSLIDAAEEDASFPAELVLVVSNVSTAYGLDRAQKAGLTAVSLPHRDFPSRAAFDEALDEILKEHRITFVCLAGFMRILTAAMVEKWSGRMLNIHPSLLPAFRGADAHGAVLESSVALSGASVHAVTAELDGGPIVAQAAIPRYAEDDREALSERVRSVERRLFPLAVKAFLREEGAPLPSLPMSTSGQLFGINPLVRYREV